MPFVVSTNHQLDVQRRALITALEEYSTRWPHELETIDRMIEFVSRQSGCYERSTVEGHLTGAAWLLHPSEPKVLLTHHRKLDKWLQLGGHADGETDMVQVAHTEAREESGIESVELLDKRIFDLDIHRIPANARDGEHLHYDIRFLFRAGSHDYVVSDESHDLAWVPIDKISRYTEETSMMRMATKWTRHHRQ